MSIARRSSLSLLTFAALIAALAATGRAQESEQYVVSGERVAVYNLAGRATIQPGAGRAVVVRVTPGGSDADRLIIEQGPIGDFETLRVIYPADRVVYRELRGTTELRVREDGTFGDRWGGRRREGERVRISHRGSGLEAHADLEIVVPQGQLLSLYLAMGEVTISNVNGRLRIDTNAGPVSASGTTGELVIDVGSGAVDVMDAEGDVDIDTGSGSVELSSVHGDLLRIDTGSGSVSVTDAAVSSLDIDTGSGSIEVRGASARSARLDTGSGSVDVELDQESDRIEIDTGSGGVRLAVPESFGATLDLETGSGDIDVDFPVTTRRWQRDRLSGRIGDGRTRVSIDTGSGSIRIVKR